MQFFPISQFSGLKVVFLKKFSFFQADNLLLLYSGLPENLIDLHDLKLWKFPPAGFPVSDNSRIVSK